jgi:DNA-binding XRE family transcriptional regulator
MANWEAGRCLLRKLRAAKGISQERLSELSNVARSTISALENDKYVINDLTVARSLASALDCRIDDLYQWTRTK